MADESSVSEQGSLPQASLPPSVPSGGTLCPPREPPAPWPPHFIRLVMMEAEPLTLTNLITTSKYAAWACDDSFCRRKFERDFPESHIHRASAQESYVTRSFLGVGQAIVNGAKWIVLVPDFISDSMPDVRTNSGLTLTLTDTCWNHQQYPAHTLLYREGMHVGGTWWPIPTTSIPTIIRILAFVPASDRRRVALDLYLMNRYLGRDEAEPFLRHWKCGEPLPGEELVRAQLGVLDQTELDPYQVAVGEMATLRDLMLVESSPDTHREIFEQYQDQLPPIYLVMTDGCVVPNLSICLLSRALSALVLCPRGDLGLLALGRVGLTQLLESTIATYARVLSERG